VREGRAAVEPVICRYFLRVTVVRRLSDMTKELDLAVHTLATYPEMNNPIKMEVRMEVWHTV
jgi:vacuolar protein sorting-associated protein 26